MADPLRILVAEDDAASLTLLERWLRDDGYAVSTAAGGHAAADLLERQSFDVIICDWLLREVQGLELARRVRRRAEPPEAGIPRAYTYIMLLTVTGGRVSFLEAMQAGADDFLVKPLYREVLAARLNVARRVLALQTANRRLLSLVPTCMYCKQVRDDQDQWHPVEEFIWDRTGAACSHTICPTCYEVKKAEFGLQSE